MADLERRRCRGRTCRAELLMVPTVNGKTMPVDATPDPDGNVALDRDLFDQPVAMVLAGTNREAARDRGIDLYMPHHATCPDVEDFRRG